MQATDLDIEERTGTATTAGQRQSSSGASITGADIQTNNSGPGPRLMTARTLTGDKVINAAEETLGEITDIMLDVPRGRIAYAVLSVGGFLGIGDRLFAIPWSSLTLDTERKCFVLNASKERIEHAPGFDKDHWPDAADTSWQQQVHNYYGASPYWQV